MGWVQSPPAFCAMSETVCDLTNEAVRSRGNNVEEHRLSAQAELADDKSRSPEPRPIPESEKAGNVLLLPDSCELDGGPLDEDDESSPSSCCGTGLGAACCCVGAGGGGGVGYLSLEYLLSRKE